MTAAKHSIILLAALLTGSTGAFAACNDSAAVAPADDLVLTTLYQREGMSVAQQNLIDAVLVAEQATLDQLLAKEQRNRAALAQAVAAGADHGSLQTLARREGQFVTDLILLQAAARQRIDALLQANPGQTTVRM